MNNFAKYIDINCDLGEGVNELDCQKDHVLMQYISSCNIACSGHAGNELTMRLSIINAVSSNLSIGAHPGHPDKANFGRQTIEISDQALTNSIRSQVDLLKVELDKHAKELSHIKFHGALYNDIEKNEQLALNMAELCKRHYPNTKLMGLANGKLQAACGTYSLGFISEGFMDRVYLCSGKLTPRSERNSVIDDPDIAIKQALALARKEPILTSDGGEIRMQVKSICLHGDNPQAPLIARLLIERFNKANINVGNGLG